MINTKKLNGWMRIWIVLTGLWFFATFSSFDSFPASPLGELRSDTVKLVKDIVAERTEGRELTVYLEQLASTNKLQALIYDSDEEKIFEIHEDIKKLNKTKMDEIESIRNSYERSLNRLNEERWDWFFFLLRALFIPPLILYVLGYLVNFIRLGFVK